MSVPYLVTVIQVSEKVIQRHLSSEEHLRHSCVMSSIRVDELLHPGLTENLSAKSNHAEQSNQVRVMSERFLQSKRQISEHWDGCRQFRKETAK